MRTRFLVPALDADAGRVALPRDEAHHLARVLRLAPGDEVTVFDGRGGEFRARVASATRDAVTVTLLDRIAGAAGPSVALTVVQAVLKHEAMDDVVRDVTMVGVESIQPVVTSRTTVKAALLARSADRWRRIALAAAKQCGRSRLPEIRDAVPFAEWVDRPREAPSFILLEPSAAIEHAITVRQLAQQAAPARATLIIGPEGGWTIEERERALASGCVPLSLGRLTLRAGAVPLAAAAALLAIWD